MTVALCARCSVLNDLDLSAPNRARAIKGKMTRVTDAVVFYIVYLGTKTHYVNAHHTLVISNHETYRKQWLLFYVFIQITPLVHVLFLYICFSLKIVLYTFVFDIKYH